MVTKVGDTYSVEVETTAAAPVEEAWSCFMDPVKSAEFFFGISFESDLKAGHPIIWRGEWQGKPFVDTGIILEIREPRLFRYDYFSSASGLEDKPENHYEVSYAFDPAPGGTRIRIAQSNSSSREGAEHSEGNWNMMLAAVKSKLEAK